MNKQKNYNNQSINEAIGRAKLVVRYITQHEAENGVGRHVCKCSTCGKVHTEGYIRIDGMTGFASEGHGRVIGKKCFFPKAYGADDYDNDCNTNFDGTDNTTQHRKPHVSVEFEIVSKLYGTGYNAVLRAFNMYPSEENEVDEAFCRVYVRLLFLGYQKAKRTNSIESDCTVSAEGHCRFRSLQGLQKFLAGCTSEELECFRDIRCGAHIHASCEFARRDWCGWKVFKPVLKRIEEMDASERAKIFGSDFRGYASDNVGGHGCCINYRTHHMTIEFRLSRIHDTEQFLRVAKWWRAVIACVNGNGVLVDEGIMKPEELGRLCGRIDVRWNKFSKGR